MIFKMRISPQFGTVYQLFKETGKPYKYDEFDAANNGYERLNNLTKRLQCHLTFLEQEKKEPKVYLEKFNKEIPITVLNMFGSVFVLTGQDAYSSIRGEAQKWQFRFPFKKVQNIILPE